MATNKIAIYSNVFPIKIFSRIISEGLSYELGIKNIKGEIEDTHNVFIVELNITDTKVYSVEKLTKSGIPTYRFDNVPDAFAIIAAAKDILDVEAEALDLRLSGVPIVVNKEAKLISIGGEVLSFGDIGTLYKHVLDAAGDAAREISLKSSTPADAPVVPKEIIELRKLGLGYLEQYHLPTKLIAAYPDIEKAHRQGYGFLKQKDVIPPHADNYHLAGRRWRPNIHAGLPVKTGLFRVYDTKTHIAHALDNYTRQGWTLEQLDKVVLEKVAQGYRIAQLDEQIEGEVETLLANSTEAKWHKDKTARFIVKCGINAVKV